LGLFLVPASLYAANLEITEIMYNPSGDEPDNEWVEVRNTSGAEICLSDWKLRENGGDHNINPGNNAESLALPAGAYAIIANSNGSDNFSGLVFKSGFGLNNSGGDVVAILDDQGNEVVRKEYGTEGDEGESLQLQGGSWTVGNPTPETDSSSGLCSNSSNTQNNDDDADNKTASGPTWVMPPREKSVEEDNAELRISAGSDISGWVGIPVELAGQVRGADSSEVAASWLLGNGDTQAGTSTSYTYQYPGEYLATFSVTTDEETLSDQLVVDIIAIKLALEVEPGSDGYTKIHNEAARRFDLSGWRLVSGGEEFVLPEHSAALANGELIVPHRVSGFYGASAAELFRPDGTLATSTEAQASTAGYSIGSRATIVQAATADTEEAETEANDESANATATAAGATSASLVLGTSTAAGTADSSGQLSVFAQWGGLLMALLLAAIGTIILMRRVSKPAKDAGVQASKFDVEEVED